MSNPQRVRVGSVTAELRDLELPIGLTLDRVAMSGADLTMAHPPLDVNLPTPGALLVELSSRRLAEFLEKQSPAGMRDFRVECRDERVHVDAVKRVLVDVKVHTVLTLRIVDRRAIYVELESVEAMGASLKNLVQSQLDGINPVVTVDDFPVHATMDRLEIGDDRVTVYGQVAPK